VFASRDSEVDVSIGRLCCLIDNVLSMGNLLYNDEMSIVVCMLVLLASDDHDCQFYKYALQN
jgi:hypothetical protein